MNKSALIQAPKKILIIRLSSIGDVLLTTPAIRLLKNRFPDAQIDFVIKKEFADLLKYHPQLSKLYQYDKNAEADSLKNIKQEIKRKRYDLIIDLHKNFRSYYLTNGSRAKAIIRYKKGVIQRFLLVKFKLDLYKKIIPIYQRYLNCLNRFEILFDGNGLDIFFNEEAERNIIAKHGNFLKHTSRLTIGIAPGAKHATKRWTAEGFSKVINFFSRNMQAANPEHLKFFQY